MDGQCEDLKPETKRDRVRRLLINPLEERGFKFAKGTPPEKQRKVLDQIADDLAYMTDAGLSTVEECMRDKGRGAARCFWPEVASFNAIAQRCEGRPLVEMPNLLSWFKSEAGRDALSADRLVAEYQFFKARHHPPLNDQDRRLVSDRARGYQEQALRIQDRIRRGKEPGPGDADWLRWFEEQEIYVRSLLTPGQDLS